MLESLFIKLILRKFLLLIFKIKGSLPLSIKYSVSSVLINIDLDFINFFRINLSILKDISYKKVINFISVKFIEFYHILIDKMN